MAQVAPRSNVGQLTGTPGYGGGRAPARAAVRKPSIVRPATQRPGADPILTLVQQILKLETAPVTAAENQRQASVARQQSDMRAAQTALVAQLQRGAQTGGQAYDQAIASTDALGRQAASYFQGQSPDAATQANLKAIGAPLAQQQAVGAANASLFSGGPNYVLGAQIPGAALNAQKAAQVGYLAGLPTVAALQGQTGMRANQLADQAAHQTYIQNLMRVTSQTPQLVQSYRAQAQSDYVNAQRAQTAAAAQLANAQYLLKKEGYTQQQIDLATKKEQDQYNLAQQNLTVAQNREGDYSRSVTNTGANAAERNRIAAQKATAAAGKARQTARGNRRKDRTVAGTKILAYGRQTLKPTYTTRRVPVYIDKNTGNPVPAGSANAVATGKYTTVKTRNKPQTYNQARAYAMGLQEVQDLGRIYGYTPRQVSDFVDTELAAAGYKVPGRATGAYGKGKRGNRRG